MAYTGSTLATLRDELLLSLDVYNANDLDETIAGSQGNQARRCLNKALQKIYSKVKRFNILQKEAVDSTITTTASQEYVDISGISDLDDVENIYEASNDVNLKEVSFDTYRQMAPDPSEATGNPVKFARRGKNRLYLFPTPDAVYTLNIFYLRTQSNLSGTSDTTGLDSKLDYWIVAEASVFWQLMEDAGDTGKLSALRQIAADCEESAMEDLATEYGIADEVDSHWGHFSEIRAPRFDSPVGS